MLVRRQSDLSGASNTMDLDITEAEIDAYTCGALVQDAFPRLSAGEREFLMTGITPAEWNATFAEESGYDSSLIP